MTTPSSLIPYFAYGSNMESATLRGRREIDFQGAVSARAVGWRLVFDKPPLFAVGESFANIIPDPSGTVFGVLYEVSATDLEHLDLTEGVLIGNYTRIAIRVQPLATPPDKLVDAFTLVSDRRDPSLQPSTRYMDRLIGGAVEHGLPADYIEWLRSVPAREPSAEARELRPFIDQLMRRR